MLKYQGTNAVTSHIHSQSLHTVYTRHVLTARNLCSALPWPRYANHKPLDADHPGHGINPVL